MTRHSFAMGFLLALASTAQALEFKNVRSSYGPLGATRGDAKFLPGDILYISYEIDGLALDPKDKGTKYETVLEVFDSKSKNIFEKKSLNEVIPQLGGNSVAGDLHVTMGLNFPPGKYAVRLSVEDRVSKERKSFLYPFDLLAPSFGLVQLTAPTVAFPGVPYKADYIIVEMGLDAAKKPNVKVEMKIFDDAGKLLTPALTTLFPRDLPGNIDLQKANFVPMQFPIFPNRTGRFMVEIAATDLVAQKTATVRYPLNVIDVAALAGK